MLWGKRVTAEVKFLAVVAYRGSLFRELRSLVERRKRGKDCRLSFKCAVKPDDLIMNFSISDLKGRDYLMATNISGKVWCRIRSSRLPSIPECFLVRT
jgi:hypothetical protein